MRGPPGCFGRRTMRHIGDAYGGGNQYCSDSLLLCQFFNLELLILAEIWENRRKVSFIRGNFFH